MYKSLMLFLYATMLASVALAQTILISQPQPNANVTAGSDITVQLAKPMALTGSEDIAVVIGTFPCTSGACPGASEVLGDIFYSGPYDAELNSDNYYPYQNFTITVPSWYSGLMQLGVAHFYLLGAGLSAELQLTSVNLNVAASG